MAATKLGSLVRKNRRALVALPVLALMLVGYQNCSVDLASTTPGASVKDSCAPTDQELTDFATVLNDLLQAQGAIGATTSLKCGSCHTPAGTHDYANIARSVFLIQNADTSADPAKVKADFCAISDRADMIPNKILSGPHTGGLYQATDVQILLDFIQNTF